MNKIVSLLMVLLVCMCSISVVAADGGSADGVGIIQALLGNVPDILKALGLLVGAASVVATMTPNKTDDSIVARVAKLVNFLALNFGHAKSVEVPGDEVIKPDSGSR